MAKVTRTRTIDGKGNVTSTTQVTEQGATPQVPRTPAVQRMDQHFEAAHAQPPAEGAQQAEDLTPVEKMTAGHQAVADARTPDEIFVDEARRKAGAVLLRLQQDQATLLRHGHPMAPEFVEMLAYMEHVTTALDQLIHNARVLLGNDALLTPTERAARYPNRED